MRTDRAWWAWRDNRAEPHPTDDVALRRELLISGRDREPTDTQLEAKRPHARQPIAGPEAAGIDGAPDARRDLAIEGLRGSPVDFDGQSG
jgi:hypothetical protein